MDNQKLQIMQVFIGASPVTNGTDPQPAEPTPATPTTKGRRTTAKRSPGAKGSTGGTQNDG